MTVFEYAMIRAARAIITPQELVEVECLARCAEDGDKKAHEELTHRIQTILINGDYRRRK
jgi:hypothetical protein